MQAPSSFLPYLRAFCVLSILSLLGNANAGFAQSSAQEGTGRRGDAETRRGGDGETRGHGDAGTGVGSQAQDGTGIVRPQTQDGTGVVKPQGQDAKSDTKPDSKDPKNPEAASDIGEKSKENTRS